MEINSTTNYPILFNDSEIQNLTTSIKKMEESLSEEKMKFQSRVSVLQQQSCNHKFQKKMEFDKNYHWSYYSRHNGEDIMLGKECSECGLFEPRPKGQPWDVCYKCGGEMKSLGKTPGQGGDGEHVYECKDCKHTVSHT